MRRKVIVYELCEIEVQPDLDGSFFDLKDALQSNQKSYEFIWRYELNFYESLIFDHCYKKLDVDVFDYYLKNKNQIKISDTGEVSMNYVENMTVIENAGKNIETIDCRVIGSIFHKIEGKSLSRCDNFTEDFEFPKASFFQFDEILQDKKDKLKRKINNLRIRQSRLPIELHDYSEYD